MAVVWPSKNNFANGDVLTATNMNNIGDTLNVFNPTSATNGQIWIANGSGSGSYQTLVSSSYTQLTTGTITSGTQLDLTGFSQSYKHLEIWVYGINYGTATTLNLIMFAGTYPSAGTTTTATTFTNGGTGTASDGTQSANGFINLMLAENNIGASNTNNFFRGTFYDYSSTNPRKLAIGFGSYRGTSSYHMDVSTGNVIQTTGAAFTTLRILGGTTFTAASYTLWGIN